MRWIFALFALLLPVSAAAQGWIEPLPRPVPLAPSQVDRVRSSVMVRVDGRVAHVEVEEWFRNNGAGPAEGDYLFPLPGEAVFSDFSLFQGEEELRGETMDAARARAIYEEIVRRHRDPALIELAGHGLLRARVFPIGSGETRRVVLRFNQVLERAGDALHFRYVGGSAPRGSRPSGRDCPRPLPAPPGVAPPSCVQPMPAGRVAGDAEAPVTFTITANDEARFGEPFSPTHELRVSRERDRLLVRPVGELRGSFDLFFPLANGGVGITLATHRVDGEDGYFMLTLTPGRAQASREPRDVAVVVDVSGSMAGEKMEQARQALHRLVGTLGAADRFRLVAFSNRVTAYRPEWTPATRAGIENVREWIDSLTATGGTNIAGAFDEAFRVPAGDGRLHLVIFVTDGLPTVGERNPDRIAAHVEASHGNARIFAFGVGYDLNTYLLERVSVAGRGTVDYVEPGEDVEEAVGSLANKLSHPVLVDLRFGGAPVRLTGLQPAQLPDLYAGQDLVVFGRYEAASGDRAGELAIAGTRAGRAERFAASVEFPEHSSANAYIPALWAARRMGELTRTMQLEGVTPERVAEIRELALRHGLLSEYTAHLVQEPGGRFGPRGVSAAPAVPQPLLGQVWGGRGGGGGGGGGAGRALDGQAADAGVASSGEAAVSQASAAARRREVSTTAQLATAEQAVLERASAAGSRVVAGRSFREESGVWIDAGHTTGARVVSVEPFSQAYVDVLARLPEIRPYWNAFESVTVAGARVSIRLAPGGSSRIDPEALARIVADFRGGDRPL